MQFVIPSNQNDRKRINDALKEICGHLTIKSAADDSIKDIADMLKEDYDMPRRTCNRLARTMHAQDFADKLADFEDFEAEFDVLIKGIK